MPQNFAADVKGRLSVSFANLAPQPLELLHDMLLLIFVSVFEGIRDQTAVIIILEEIVKSRLVQDLILILYGALGFYILIAVVGVGPVLAVE